jgi:hypothetical protein
MILVILPIQKRKFLRLVKLTGLRQITLKLESSTQPGNGRIPKDLNTVWFLTTYSGQKAIARWVDHYNLERYHDPSDNITPADVYEGVDTSVKEPKLPA